MPQIYIKNYILIIFTVIFIYSCSKDSLTSDERAKRAAKSNQDIYIGIVDSSFDHSLFSEGVKMAIEEINDRGGVLERKIKTISHNDHKYHKDSQDIARKLAANPDVVAVIDCRYSKDTIPASIVYNNHGILFISTGTSDPSLTQYDSQLTFRNTVSDIDTGKEIAQFAYQQGYKKIAVVYERESAGQRLGDKVCEDAVKLGINIVAVRSYFHWQEDFSHIISELSIDYEFDAIFLGGLLPYTGEFIKQARIMGIKVPIIGSPSLDSLELFSIAGKSAEHVIVPTIFNPNMPEQQIIEFVKKFKKEFGLLPDTLAALGYEAIQLLTHVIETNESTVPVVMASALRFLENWSGVTGTYSFKQNGDIKDKKIFFKEFIGGKFEILEYGKKKIISPSFINEEHTLRIPVERPIETVDPAYAFGTYSYELVEQLFLGLTDLNPATYEVIPELAESWTASNNGKQYTFKLREDVKWTNGKPVTANDIVWAIQRNISPEMNCFGAYFLYVLKNAAEIHNGKIKDKSKIGVRALDDFTVLFDLVNSSPIFPSMAGLPIFRPVPKETVEKYDLKWTDPDFIQTNGSYKLVFWNKNQVIILKKNSAYFDAKNVAIPEIRYNIIPDNEVGLVMYKNNELDIIGGNYLKISFSKLFDIQTNPKINEEYYVKPTLSTYAYGFNLKEPPMNNPLVRKAICAAVDREFLIELVIKRDEMPATTYTPPPILGPFKPEENIGINFDPLQAKKWLAEAGYPEANNFPTIELIFDSSKNHLEIARAVKASLKYYLNIQLQIRSVKRKDYYKYIRQEIKSHHHMFRFGWSTDYPDANGILNELFNPNGPTNLISCDDQEYVDLMKKAIEINDNNERKQIYKRAEKILCGEKTVILPLFFESAHYLVKKRVKNWNHMAIGGQHIRNWSLEKTNY